MSFTDFIVGDIITFDRDITFQEAFEKGLSYEMQDSSIIEISLLRREGKLYLEPLGACLCS